MPELNTTFANAGRRTISRGGRWRWDFMRIRAVAAERVVAARDLSRRAETHRIVVGQRRRLPHRLIGPKRAAVPGPGRVEPTLDCGRLLVDVHTTATCAGSTISRAPMVVTAGTPTMRTRCWARSALIVPLTVTRERRLERKLMSPVRQYHNTFIIYFLRRQSISAALAVGPRFHQRAERHARPG